MGSQFVYTYHLPYGVRREICNLLDADQSWRMLGGQFVGLDATQLTLIGQAYLRNGSPTEELLNRLDSANVRTSELCHYLRQMNHCRALDMLRPYQSACENTNDAKCNSSGVQQHQDPSGRYGRPPTSAVISTLDTPTPSFSEQSTGVMALMGAEQIVYDDYLVPAKQVNLDQHFLAQNNSEHNMRLHKCHKTEQQLQQQQFQNNQHQQNPDKQQYNDNKGEKKHQSSTEDPGEEIVRMACANNRKRTSISDQEVVNQLRLIMQINYTELKLASDDFSNSNILGNGGFASVYRGHWKGTDVAIKRLKCNLMDQALNELTILNSYRIDNILPIYGISIDGPEACLVYQFMANGSLEDRLSCKKDTPPLTWNQRALIGEGVAKGLYYLHTLRDKPLVHGDVKSANVLLDSQFVPKLGDFGLARQVFKGKNPQTELCTHCTVSSIHGTSVYLPPEYLRHKILSPAVDVYSYGIVLLEMATGKRAYDGKRLLIDIVEDETQSMAVGQISYSLKDPGLAGDTQNDLKIWFELLIKLGLNCAHKIKRRRPDMGQVLSKFASFRTNGDLTNSNGTTLGNLQLFASQENGTGRILTPDLAGGANIGSVRRKVTPPVPPQQPNRPAASLLAINSALMSVEEEQVEQQQKAANGGAQVEAMIPLLTELGIQQEQ